MINSEDGVMLPQPYNNVNPFDSIRQLDEQGREYWSARALQKLLGYRQWRYFEESIERAKISMQINGDDINSNFAEVRKDTNKGKYSSYTVNDYHLTRDACYQIAQCGDVRKPEIAAAQAYFRKQTQFAEAIQQGKLQLPIQNINNLFHDRVVLNERYSTIPVGYFTIFEQIAFRFAKEEYKGLVLKESAVIDISIGKRFNKYLQENGYDLSLRKEYPHYYPDQRTIKPAKAYPNAWTGIFRDWFDLEYMTVGIVQYLKNNDVIDFEHSDQNHPLLLAVQKKTKELR